MDKIIELKISGSHLSRDSQTAGVQHEGNAAVLRMAFDPGWDGFAKTVTFWNARGQHPVKRLLTTELLENMTADSRIYLCPIPAEAMEEAGWLTYVVDGMADGVRRRSVEDRLKVLPALYAPEAEESTDPTPTQAEQLQVQVDNLLGTLQAGIASSSRAIASAEAAAQSEKAASASRQAAGESEKKAAASEQSAGDSAVEARSYAQGGTGTREGEDRANAKYYMEQAQKMAGGEFLTEEQLEQRLEQLTAESVGARPQTWTPTAAEVGAAAAGHKHTAGDITGGTFAAARLPTVSVSKGGTGRTSLAAGSYLVGNGTSAAALRTPAQVLSDIGASAVGHIHTAAQVGLGSVPNVATNNQTPTYAAAGTLANLTSGEKLSVAMGKLAKAVKDLISHLGSRGNPHAVTAAQTGAAPATRKVNGKALSSDITLSAADVGAMGFDRVLNTADDLNAVLVNGIYCYTTGSAPANAPYENASIVEVFGSNSTSTQKIQRVSRYGVPGCTKMRTLTGGAWTGWKEYASTDYAISKAGDTMTGDLTVQRTESPTVHFRDAANGTAGMVRLTKSRLLLASIDRADSVSDYRMLAVNNAADYPSLTQALRLTDRVDGVSVVYDVLHTGNVVASQTDITAGSAVGWHQYLVYA